MIPLDRAVVARLESHGERFEIGVDPDLAQQVRQGAEIPIEDVVAAETVFENFAHGDRASEETLQKVFETTEFEPIARRILTKGEIHLTSDQRKRMIEERRRQVVTYIARNAVNPQTKLPHPPQRIEMAMEEARVNIDPFKSVEEQVKVAMKALRPIIPIRFEELRVAVRIPADHAPRAYGEMQAAVTVEREEWQNDGSWICVCRIPAGVQNDFYTLVNRLSKGDGEVKVLEQVY
ncbi:ribosome assembly factor SBDS [Methanofollis formosanus]|uniref:Ribosome assembly factor SBDS n=1 Tax=Methanofollis formosanus TaxID=299308 RepID=A0A8G1A2D0_9EURY|nr:ribosome assembly factor SBDS [Methanofollis formosanus]QYZ79805.1 ribosome assembly factor SBDS [Methanofollis formosanus]